MSTWREGKKFGIPCEYLRAANGTMGKITITPVRRARARKK